MPDNAAPPSADLAGPELSKTYEPQSVDSRWYDIWEKAGYFEPNEKGKPYVIVIPPPNVTGSLHMGHALNSTLQDILTRFKRMRGFSALWVPGTDHGGIATQNVVEKMLKKEEGKTRQDLGRDAFLKKMWAWREESGDQILLQLRKIGASLDWAKTRFTMDEVCSRAVRHAFVELYNKSLLYRGKRLVNWCPRCQTALADIEVEHKETKGHLWHIRYPLLERRKIARPAGKKKAAAPGPLEMGYVIVATTRPETLLGDTGVAVNPKDRRYKALVGSLLTLPLTGRNIPVVADAAVDQTFGSGAVKVTPAHDPTDFEIAERTKLSHITVIGFDGKMTSDAGADFAGLDRFDARKKVVEELEKIGLLEKIEDYKLSLSVCYRCESVIEPLESEQWFLKMGDMAKAARDANKKGKVKIFPKSWESPYQLWLRNLKDWCVSRQIWWGHRIPVWYCVTEKNGKKARTAACPPIVPLEDPIKCPTCGSGTLEQDPDVLDTWFSSALWPFSVFKWPDETPDFKKFFPTSTLVTGHEILYLWVARMIMFSLQFHGKVPFSSVLIHGIVRDKQGRKMSKSLGNVIDPLDLIKEFGADAMRFALAQMAAPGRDMQLSKENFLAMRNFANKVWNATRFALMHLSDMTEIPSISSVSKNFTLTDRWILHRYAEVVSQTGEAIESMNMDAASRLLYDFFWGDFCDWYLEMAKPRVDKGHPNAAHVSDEARLASRAALATVLEGTIRLLHPFMPFITEELWQKMPKPAGTTVQHVMVASWPEVTGLKSAEAAQKIGLLQEVVTKLRTIRSEMGIPPPQRIDMIVRSKDANLVSLLKDQEDILLSLNSKVGKLTIDPMATRPKASAAAVVPGADLYVPLEGLIDFVKEKGRLEKEVSTLRQDVDRLSKKLSNSDFLTHAPDDEVAKVKARLTESNERIHRLEENIDALS